MNIKIAPKDWKKFQHYAGRTPPWIKLHRGLLDDYNFHVLPVASKALAPCLWLLASEYENGLIDASEKEVAFRLRVSVSELRSAIKPLIDNGFFIDASGVLAGCYQDAILDIEKETEKDIEVEEEKETRARRASFVDPDFENRFWREWPNKVGKPAAMKAWAAARKRGHSVASIMIGLEIYVSNKPPDRPWLNPSTFLNQERFLDQPAQAAEKQSTMSRLFELSKEYENEQGSSSEVNFDNFGVIPFRK